MCWLGWECVWVVFTALVLAYGASDVEGPTALVSHPLAESLSRWTLWDGWYFIGIAQGGYTHANLAAFYPLYPLLVHAALWLTHPTSQPATARSCSSVSLPITSKVPQASQG